LKQYLGICLHEMRNMCKNLNQNIRYLVRDFNLGPPPLREY
jgi:hypothetical protein